MCALIRCIDGPVFLHCLCMVAGKWIAAETVKMLHSIHSKLYVLCNKIVVHFKWKLVKCTRERL